jgi:hypothetical protein
MSDLMVAAEILTTKEPSPEKQSPETRRRLRAGALLETV